MHNHPPNLNLRLANFSLSLHIIPLAKEGAERDKQPQGTDVLHVVLRPNAFLEVLPTL